MTDPFDAAVRAFWTGRDLQTQKQILAGTVDAGSRGAVTGGLHLSPMQDAVAELFTNTPGLPGLEVRHSGRLSLPGFYRRSKDWDLLVTYRGVLVAAIEFKSQVGPSFGNNFNNRTEEAIGNAVDVWRATEEGVFGAVRPWLGFVMLIESAPASVNPLRRNAPTIYPADPIFDNTGYVARYRILLQRLVRERLYDAAALIATPTGGGIVDDTVPELGMKNFAAAIKGRLAYIEGLGLPLHSGPTSGPRFSTQGGNP